MHRAGICFFLALCVGCAKVKAPTPATAPCNRMDPDCQPHMSPLSATVHLCAPDDERPECEARRAQFDYKQHAKTLIELLQEDFPNTVRIDRALRDRMAAVMEWLLKHRYD